MMEPVAAGDPNPRAYLQVGGVPLARHQLGLVLALGCGRIVCLARELGPELIAMQHVAERAKAQFHVISSARALAGLVSTADEVIILGEGILAFAEVARALIEAGPAVLVLPAETAVSAGFERIDLETASAGAMRLPGRLIERLSELPADCNVASSLTRIALQAGIAQRVIPSELRDGARWSMLRNEAEAHAIEAPWIRLHTGTIHATTPARFLAIQAVRRLGPALLHAGTGPNSVILAGAMLVLIAMGLGWFGFVAASLIIGGIGWTLRKSAGLLSRVERDSLQDAPGRWPGQVVFGWVFDCALVALIGWGLPLAPQDPLIHRYFPPLMLLGLSRVLPRAIPNRWTAWLSDRLVLTVGLAVASAAGVLGYTVYAAAIALALAGVELPRKPVPQG